VAFITTWFFGRCSTTATAKGTFGRKYAGRILKAAGQFEKVARNKLGDAYYTSPAVSRGQIFVRSKSHPYCIDAWQEEGFCQSSSTTQLVPGPALELIG
jgi:hypothetical protein